jgi:ankyrin repeat protein
MAVKEDKLDVLKFLIKNGADIYAENNFRETPLNVAILRNKTSVVAILKNEQERRSNLNRTRRDTQSAC